jgi:hypothetical protein
MARCCALPLRFACLDGNDNTTSLEVKESVPPIARAWKCTRGSVCPALGMNDNGSLPKSNLDVGADNEGLGITTALGKSSAAIKNIMTATNNNG